MSDLRTIAKQEMERTSLYEDSMEICRALLNAPYSSDYWAGEAECHIRGLWDHTKTLHKLLKAALAQSEWQGLTDEEIQSIHDTYHKRMGPQEFARAIEAALKEKNK